MFLKMEQMSVVNQLLYINQKKWTIGCSLPFLFSTLSVSTNDLALRKEKSNSLTLMKTLK
jgi:hypothetical protein